MKYKQQEDSFSYFAILALMDNTSIILGNGNVLKIDKANVFFARGDLVHAGNGYSEEHIHLHLYFDRKKFLAANLKKARASYPVYSLNPKEQKKCATIPININLEKENFLARKKKGKDKIKRRKEIRKQSWIL
jgi:hypothetical protein